MKKWMLLLTIFLISTQLYSFPGTERYHFAGGITYSNNNKLKLGYIVYRYSNAQKVAEEVYNSTGKLIKYKIYTYDLSNQLIKEAEYNSLEQPVKKAEYEYSDGKRSRKIITHYSATGNKKPPLYVDYDYSYYRNRMIEEIESYYHNEAAEAQLYTLVKKKVYTQYNEFENLIEHFRKESDNPKANYRFVSAELYRYNGEGNIREIIRFNQNRNPEKYYEYLYGGDGSIRKINIYVNKKNYQPWYGSFHHLTRDKFVLSRFVVYEYDKDKFAHITPLGGLEDVAESDSGGGRISVTRIDEGETITIESDGSSDGGNEVIAEGNSETREGEPETSPATEPATDTSDDGSSTDDDWQFFDIK